MKGNSDWPFVVGCNSRTATQSTDPLCLAHVAPLPGERRHLQSDQRTRVMGHLQLPRAVDLARLTALHRASVNGRRSIVQVCESGQGLELFRRTDAYEHVASLYHDM